MSSDLEVKSDNHGQIISFTPDVKPGRKLPQPRILKGVPDEESFILNRRTNKINTQAQDRAALADALRKSSMLNIQMMDALEEIINPKKRLRYVPYSEPSYMRRYYKGRVPKHVTRSEYYNPRTYTQVYNRQPYSSQATKRRRT